MTNVSIGDSKISRRSRRLNLQIIAETPNPSPQPPKGELKFQVPTFISISRFGVMGKGYVKIDVMPNLPARTVQAGFGIYAIETPIRLDPETSSG